MGVALHFADTHLVPIELFRVELRGNFASVAVSGDIIPHGQLASTFGCVFGLFVSIPIDDRSVRLVLEGIPNDVIAFDAVFDDF